RPLDSTPLSPLPQAKALHEAALFDSLASVKLRQLLSQTFDDIRSEFRVFIAYLSRLFVLSELLGGLRRRYSDNVRLKAQAFVDQRAVDNKHALFCYESTFGMGLACRRKGACNIVGRPGCRHENVLHSWAINACRHRNCCGRHADAPCTRKAAGLCRD